MVNLLLIILGVAVVAYAGWRTVSMLLMLVERRTLELERQELLLGKFYEEASKLLKGTNDAEHAKIRQMMVWLPAGVVSGDLAHAFLLSKLQRELQLETKPDQKTSIELDKEYAALPKEMAQTFGKAIGLAIFASTYSLAFRGASIRSFMGSITSPDRPEISNPERTAKWLQPVMAKRPLAECVAA